MDLTSVVAIEATYDLSNTQWELAFLTREHDSVLFFVDFDHAHALSPDELGWGEPLLQQFRLAFAPGGGWKADHTGRWRATVRPSIPAERLLGVG